MKYSLLLCTLLIAAAASAQEPVFVSDINKNIGFGSYPQNGISYKDKLLFMANDDAYGTELWVSDGTDKGTVLVKDANQAGDGQFTEPVLYRGLVSYIGGSIHANSSRDFAEIWQTNGTNAATQPRTFINVSPTYGSNITDLTKCGDTLYFSADDDVHGQEPWIYYGPDAGGNITCHLLKDVNANGTAGSYPTQFTAYNGKVYFAANGLLWMTDGTDAGTVVVKDKAGNQVTRPNNLTVCRGKLFYTAGDLLLGLELFITDGTEPGTHIVKDIYPGLTQSSTPRNLIAYNGKLYFACNDGAHGQELWVSDGTDAGTNMVQNIGAGNISGNPDHLFVYKGKLYFAADDGSGVELWCSDGTANNTAMLKRLNSFTHDSNPHSFTTHGSKLYFIARTDATGYQLWVTDGNEDSTKMLLPTGTANYDALVPGEGTLVSAGASLYFAANYDSSMGAELYRVGPPVTGIEQQSAVLKSIAAYPNPAKENITLQYTLTEAGTPTYILYDVAGRCVSSWVNEGIQAAGKHTQQLNITHLPLGTYQLQVEVNGTKQVVRVVKE